MCIRLDLFVKHSVTVCMSHLRYLAFVSCESLIIVTVLLLLVFHVPLHRSSVWQHRMVAEWKDCSEYTKRKWHLHYLHEGWNNTESLL